MASGKSSDIPSDKDPDPDIDREKGQRSVIVTKIPPGTKIKDLIIHFQKPSNGGGEVNDETKMLEEGKALVIFDDIKVAQRVLTKEHEFNGTSLHLEPIYMQVFSLVSAKLDPSCFPLNADELKDHLTKAQNETGIKFIETCDGFLLSGNFEQIHKGRLYLSRFAKRRQVGHQSDDEEESPLKPIALDVEPKLMHILRRQIQAIEEKYKLTINWKREMGKAHLSPKGDDAKSFEDGKEEFISLYQKEFQDLQEKDLPLDAVNKHTDLDSVIKSLMDEFNVVIERNRDNGIHIFGKENDVTQVMQRLQAKSGRRKARQPYRERDNGELPKPDTYAQAAMQSLSKTLGNGVVVSVHQGDLTKQHVDVIVNAANDELKHGGGVAGAILRQGGQRIQQESDDIIWRYGRVPVGKVAYTGPGNLPCKCIFHAVGPQWHTHGENSCRQLIYDACLNCFNMASQHGMSSIALPGISSGLYGVPKMICAEMMFAAAEAFSYEVPNGNQLKDIRFVNIDTPTYEAFRKEFQNRYGAEKVLASNPQNTGVVDDSRKAKKETDAGKRSDFDKADGKQSTRSGTTERTSQVSSTDNFERRKREEAAVQRMGSKTLNNEDPSMNAPIKGFSKGFQEREEHIEAGAKKSKTKDNVLNEEENGTKSTGRSGTEREKMKPKEKGKDKDKEKENEEKEKEKENEEKEKENGKEKEKVEKTDQEKENEIEKKERKRDKEKENKQSTDLAEENHVYEEVPKEKLSHKNVTTTSSFQQGFKERRDSRGDVESETPKVNETQINQRNNKPIAMTQPENKTPTGSGRGRGALGHLAPNFGTGAKPGHAIRDNGQTSDKKPLERTVKAPPGLEKNKEGLEFAELYSGKNNKTKYPENEATENGGEVPSKKTKLEAGSEDHDSREQGKSTEIKKEEDRKQATEESRCDTRSFKDDRKADETQTEVTNTGKPETGFSKDKSKDPNNSSHDKSDIRSGRKKDSKELKIDGDPEAESKTRDGVDEKDNVDQVHLTSNNKENKMKETDDLNQTVDVVAPSETKRDEMESSKSNVEGKTTGRSDFLEDTTTAPKELLDSSAEDKDESEKYSGQNATNEGKPSPDKSTGPEKSLDSSPEHKDESGKYFDQNETEKSEPLSDKSTGPKKPLDSIAQGKDESGQNATDENKPSSTGPKEPLDSSAKNKDGSEEYSVKNATDRGTPLPGTSTGPTEPLDSNAEDKVKSGKSSDLNATDKGTPLQGTSTVPKEPLDSTAEDKAKSGKSSDQNDTEESEPSPNKLTGPKEPLDSSAEDKDERDKYSDQNDTEESEPSTDKSIGPKEPLDSSAEDKDERDKYSDQNDLEESEPSPDKSTGPKEPLDSSAEDKDERDKYSDQNDTEKIKPSTDTSTGPKKPIGPDVERELDSDQDAKRDDTPLVSETAHEEPLGSSFIGKSESEDFSDESSKDEGDMSPAEATGSTEPLDSIAGTSDSIHVMADSNELSSMDSFVVLGKPDQDPSSVATRTSRSSEGSSDSIEIIDHPEEQEASDTTATSVANKQADNLARQPSDQEMNQSKAESATISTGDDTPEARKKGEVKTINSSMQDSETRQDNSLDEKASSTMEVSQENAVSSLPSKTQQECGVCFADFEPCEALKICVSGHMVCQKCFLEIQDSGPKSVCPTCQISIQKCVPQPPNGKMKSGVTEGSVPGYDGCATIYIDYEFPGGIQSALHPNPGSPYDELSRRTFLPDNQEGREVLELFNKAFDAGILFTVGKSTITSNEKDNQIIFNSAIEHKYNVNGGPSVGYPDPDYLGRVKAQLKENGIE